MRKFIDIIGLFESKLPQYLYHGTADVAWREIRKHDQMFAMEGTDHENSISFTSSEEVAEDFAREAAKNDIDARKGVVIVFDANKLASMFELVEFHDETLSGSWSHFMSEDEYRIERGHITGIKACVAKTYPVKKRVDPKERMSTSSIIANAVKAVRDEYAPNFQGNCEGAIGDLSDFLTQNDIPHQTVEGRYMQEMDWGDGTKHPFTPHWWIEVGNFILDPTREQFGSSNLIVNKNHDKGYYQRGGVGQT